MPSTYMLTLTEHLSSDDGWLARQPVPVIAIGADRIANADLVVEDEEAAAPLIKAIDRTPDAALVLVQVLRLVESLPVQEAMTLESFAYGVLQSGSEHRAWLAARNERPVPVVGGDEAAVDLVREGSVLRVTLNRPVNHNALTVEMRDALVEAFELVVLDETIERLELTGAGRCFCVGGELREFGLSTDPVQAHRIRTVHNPSRLLAAISERVHCHVHGACVGSGIELPAFAARVSADSKTFFQLPEVAMGLIPGAGGCVSISRRIGRQRAAWLALSGRRINATMALEWGLVDQVID